MCGIAGAMAFEGSNFEISAQYLEKIRDTMMHRGPDGAGLWCSEDRRVGLAHRRLSIIDLSDNAAQPMTNEDGSLRLTFNGEIYNHAEIRRELQQIGGHTWRTDHSDTEVILHAFEQWGIDCLHRFRGMFAFALWDNRKRELWLVRDRIGVKPLYYSLHHGRVVFASEIKALLADPEQRRAVDEDSLYHYLTFVTTPAPNTLFQGIKKLPSGTWLRVRPDGSTTEHRYYEVWDHAHSLAGVPMPEVHERILDELRAAVQLRKVSDVPVGVFLSGGVDSSTNAALFSEGENSAVRTFSIGYSGDNASYQNELHHARAMANIVGAEHHERLLNLKDLLDFLPRMIHLQDEPIADPVCVPLHYVSDLARRSGVIVAQVGEGADELYSGYPSWSRIARLQQANNQWPLRPAMAMLGGLLRLAPRLRENVNVEQFRRAGQGHPIFWGGTWAYMEPQKAPLLHPRLRHEFQGRSTWEVIEPIYQRFKDKAWDQGPLHWMTFMDLNVRLPELLLMRVDKMSMGVSLEARVPFLDHKFVELALSIPSAVKSNGAPKHVLKSAVRGVIPDELIDRKKQGFDVPLDDWLLDQLGDEMRAELDSFCRRTEFFDMREVNRLISGRRALHVWFLFNFALWHKHWIN